ncbi:hypothetical protein H0H81_003009 [Sphagnurus paluster]|uniref:F-box domain-containing protein n=1 Tax=Sphagnurus paluster TaxID=117069 RepID=A0A9P7KJR3_9AGAR|nr:hypothetical protein H0H81_003009 [Sphagnurus paluster]
MPPKKRARKIPSANAANLRNSTLTLQPHHNHNICTTLPVELWLEILSYYPAEEFYKGIYWVCLERTGVLRALSQTNQHLRRIFLPKLWERFEISSAETGAWYKTAGEALLRKSEGILQSPHLASYTSTVLPAFVKCLNGLPNLETITIAHAHTAMTTVLKNAFQGSIFPSVRTVVLPDYAHEILRCCPNVRRVICTHKDGTKLISAIAKHKTRTLEVLEGIATGEASMKRKSPLKNVPHKPDSYYLGIVKAAPNLKVFKFGRFSEAVGLTSLYIHHVVI